MCLAAEVSALTAVSCLDPEWLVGVQSPASACYVCWLRPITRDGCRWLQGAAAERWLQPDTWHPTMHSLPLSCTLCSTQCTACSASQAWFAEAAVQSLSLQFAGWAGAASEQVSKLRLAAMGLVTAACTWEEFRLTRAPFPEPGSQPEGYRCMHCISQPWKCQSGQHLPEPEGACWVPTLQHPGR